MAALAEALGTREPVRPPLPKGIEKFYYRGDFLVVEFWSAIANRLITRVDVGVESPKEAMAGDTEIDGGYGD